MRKSFCSQQLVLFLPNNLPHRMFQSLLRVLLPFFSPSWKGYSEKKWRNVQGRLKNDERTRNDGWNIIWIKLLGRRRNELLWAERRPEWMTVLQHIGTHRTAREGHRVAPFFEFSTFAGVSAPPQFFAHTPDQSAHSSPFFPRGSIISAPTPFRLATSKLNKYLKTRTRIGFQ